MSAIDRLRHARRALTLGLCCAGAAAPAQTPADLPPIGTIDFFGLRSVTEASARAVLPFAPGDRLPDYDTGPLAATMAAALGVERIEFTFVCCSDAGLYQLYVGVEEAPGTEPAFGTAPTGDVELPAPVVASFDTFLERLTASVLRGNAREDRSQGHALAEDPAVREMQAAFLIYAAQYEDLLIETLRASRDEKQRAVAAHVLGYVEDKAAIVDDLADALRDPSDEVRNYATRALAIIAGFAVDHPTAGIEIPAEALVDLSNSTVWSDRNKSLAVLSQLTRTHDERLLATLRMRSLPSLIEMCRWQHWGHAEPACSVLRRIVGLPEDARASSRVETLDRATG